MKSREDGKMEDGSDQERKFSQCFKTIFDNARRMLRLDSKELFFCVSVPSFHLFAFLFR